MFVFVFVHIIIIGDCKDADPVLKESFQYLNENSEFITCYVGDRPTYVFFYLSFVLILTIKCINKFFSSLFFFLVGKTLKMNSELMQNLRLNPFQL